MNEFELIRAARPAVAPPSADVIAAAKTAMWAAENRRPHIGRARRRRMMRIPIAIMAAAAAAALVVTFVRLADDRSAPPATTTTTPTQPAITGLPAPITITGVGGARLGMTPAELGRVWNTPIVPEGGTGPACQVAIIRKNGVQGSAIFAQRRLASLWFSRAGVTTDRGVGIGSTLADLRTTYSPLAESPNHYDARAIDAYYEPAGAGKPGLRFNVNASGKIIEIAWGDDTIHLLEGCA